MSDDTVVHIGWFIANQKNYVCQEWQDRWVKTRPRLERALSKISEQGLNYTISFEPVEMAGDDFAQMFDDIGYLLNGYYQCGHLRKNEYPFKVILILSPSALLFYRLADGPMSFVKMGLFYVTPTS